MFKLQGKLSNRLHEFFYHKKNKKRAQKTAKLNIIPPPVKMTKEQHSYILLWLLIKQTMKLY